MAVVKNTIVLNLFLLISHIIELFNDLNIYFYLDVYYDELPQFKIIQH